MKSKTVVLLLAVASAISVIVAVLVPPLLAGGLAAGVVCALAGVSLNTLWLHRRLRKIEAELSGIQHATTKSIAAELHSMQVILHRFPQCTLPTTDWSMRFANLHTLVDLLDKTTPATILEFGSGISTLCGAAWLREKGRGRLISFDHGPSWAEVTRRYLATHGLEEFAEVIVAPLLEINSNLGRVNWYDVGTSLDRLDDIDLVIVDGPPAWDAQRKLSRYPALPAVYDRLAPAAVIVLDDANRPGEMEVARRWISEYPDFQLRLVASVSGMAVLQRDRDQQTHN